MLAHISSPHVPVLREAEIRHLKLNEILTFEMRNKPVGHSIVISPEHYREFVELKSQLVETVLYLSLLVHDCGKNPVHTSAAYLLHRLHAAEHGAVSHIHADMGILQQNVTVMFEAVSYSISRLNGNLQASVRRGQFIILRCSENGNCHERQCQYGYQFMHNLLCLLYSKLFFHRAEQVKCLQWRHVVEVCLVELLLQG